MIGTYVAKMASDVFFKNPTEYSWNYKNSDVLNSEWGEAPNFIQGLDQLFRYWGWDPILSDD